MTIVDKTLVLSEADAVADYLKEIEPPQRERKTYIAYKYCLELFQTVNGEKIVRKEPFRGAGPGTDRNALYQMTSGGVELNPSNPF